MTTPRGPTSRGELDIDWDHPVYEPEAAPSDGRTVAAAVRTALPLERAYAAIAGDDPRPLLVLRECLTCTGTDDALLTRRADNEKTMLMSRWFHCVKLPPDVLDENHPFHALFAGDKPCHLFVSARDGSGRRELNGAQSRSELWTVMEERLKLAYADDETLALKELQGLLDDFDEVDGRIAELQERLDHAIEKDGPDSRKARKAKGELTELFAQRSKLQAKAAAASHLAPRPTRNDEPKTPRRA